MPRRATFLRGPFQALEGPPAGGRSNWMCHVASVFRDRRVSPLLSQWCRVGQGRRGLVLGPAARKAGPLHCASSGCGPRWNQGSPRPTTCALHRLSSRGARCRRASSMPRTRCPDRVSSLSSRGFPKTATFRSSRKRWRGWAGTGSRRHEPRDCRSASLAGADASYRVRVASGGDRTVWPVGRRKDQRRQPRRRAAAPRCGTDRGRRSCAFRPYVGDISAGSAVPGRPCLFGTAGALRISRSCRTCASGAATGRTRIRRRSAPRRRLAGATSCAALGGERSRVTIWHALRSDPDMPLMDGTRASLDALRSAEIPANLERVRASISLPMLSASDEPAELAQLAATLVLSGRGGPGAVRGGHRIPRGRRVALRHR